MVKGPSTDLQEFRKVVKSSRNIIAIAGAGLSAASGDYPSERPPFMSFTIYRIEVYPPSAMAEGYGGSMRL
jgi:NAD-dependent SIR2 family protein deacetylase